jgi:uracil-DNA glycosylase
MFVGPAGQLFDRALAQAGIDGDQADGTHAVKHFKFEPRGKRRLHWRPNAGEIDMCRWWVDQTPSALVRVIAGWYEVRAPRAVCFAKRWW